MPREELALRNARRFKRRDEKAVKLERNPFWDIVWGPKLVMRKEQLAHLSATLQTDTD